MPRAAEESRTAAPGTVLNDYRHALVYFRREWRSLGLLVLLGFVAAGFAVVLPWPLKLLIDTLQGTGDTTGWLTWFGFQNGSPGAFILIAAFGSILAYGLASLIDMGLTYGWSKTGQRMVYDLASDLYAKLQQRSLAHDNPQSVGDSLNRLFGDSWCLYTIAYAVLTVPLQHLLTVAAVGYVAWTLDPELAVIAAGAVPFATVLAYVLAQRLRRLARDDARLTSDIMAFIQQTLSVIPLIQTFGAAGHTHKIYREMTARGVGIAGRSALVNQAVLTVSNLTVAGATAAILLVGGEKVLSGTMTLGVLVVFLAYLKTINSAVETCLNTLVKIVTAHASLRRVSEILDDGPGLTDAPNAVAYAKPRERKAGRIVFESVSFGYPGKTPVLRKLDLVVEPGQTVALVGPSGGGKSTLVSLIPRFFDPVAGRVTLDGQDIKGLTLASLREQIAIVLQDSFLMPMTIAENIAYEPKAHSRDEAVAAAVASGAHDFIRRLPDGFDTMLGQNGASLSGGQKQLIAIARALLKNAPVLILDEPTSALDVETEAQVMAGIRKLTAERTTFIVAHRLSTIRAADRVLFVDGGEVRELTSLAELDGHFRDGAAG